MLEVKVNISIEGLEELISATFALADAMMARVTAIEAPQVSEETKKMRGRKAAKAEEKQAAEPVVEKEEEVMPTPVVQEQPPVQEPDTAKSNAATLYKLSEAGASLLEAGKMQELIALLHTFKVEAVTMLKPEQYEAFAKGLRGLGAKI